MKFFSNNKSDLQTKSNYEAELYIYDLKNNDIREKGFKTLKEKQNKGFY